MRASTSSRSSPSRPQIIPARMSFVDIAGLVKGASKGEGLGNQFLANIRECDAIAYVLRCFEDPQHHPRRQQDRSARRRRSGRDRADAGRSRKPREAPQRRREESQGRRQGSQAHARPDRPLARRCCATASRRASSQRSAEEEKAFRELQLLTSKPALYVCNVDEASAATGNAMTKQVEDYAKQHNAAVDRHLRRDREPARAAPRRRAGRVPRNPRPARARPQSTDPRSLPTAWPADLFHRRPEGGARLDHPQGRPRPAGGRRHPHRFRTRLHPRPDHRLRRLRHPRRRSPRQGSRQGPRRRQGIRRQGRRRDAVQVQHLMHCRPAEA